MSKSVVFGKKKAPNLDDVERITIVFRGNLRFKQALTDRIYEVLSDEDLLAESAKPGCGFTFDPSVVPSEEVGDEG